MPDWTRRLRVQHLDALLSLGETQNISRSAERFNLSQPALSRWLKELEAELGVPLFERHARGLRPTREGRTLIDHAQRIVTDVARARDEMDAIRQGSSNRIVIGASGAAIASVIPDAVARLLETMPKAAIQIVEAPMDRLLQQLAGREIDFAIGRPSTLPDDPDVVSEPLYEDRVHLAVRPDHPLFALAALDWADVLAFRWIIWSTDSPVRRLIDSGLAAAGGALPMIGVQSNSMLASIGLAMRTDMVLALSDKALELPEQLRALRRLPLKLIAGGKVAIFSHRSAAASEVYLAMRTALHQSVWH